MYLSTLGLRVIQKKKISPPRTRTSLQVERVRARVWGVQFGRYLKSDTVYDLKGDKVYNLGIWRAMFPLLTRICRQVATETLGGLVYKAHRLVYHSTLGWRVIKQKKKRPFSGAWGV